MPGFELTFNLDRCVTASILGGLACFLCWLCYREGLRHGLTRGIHLERRWAQKQQRIRAATPPPGYRSDTVPSQTLFRPLSSTELGARPDLARTLPEIPNPRKTTEPAFVPGPRAHSSPPPIPGVARRAPFDYESVEFMDPDEQSIPVILDAIAEELDLLDLAEGDPIFVKIGSRFIQAVADSAPEVRAGIHAVRVRGATISPSGKAWIELKYIQRRRVR